MDFHLFCEIDWHRVRRSGTGIVTRTCTVGTYRYWLHPLTDAWTMDRLNEMDRGYCDRWTDCRLETTHDGLTRLIEFVFSEAVRNIS